MKIVLVVCQTRDRPSKKIKIWNAQETCNTNPRSGTMKILSLKWSVNYRQALQTIKLWNMQETYNANQIKDQCSKQTNCI